MVRSRCFSLADGVGEDEATGSAAIMLSAALERPLTIHQGRAPCSTPARSARAGPRSAAASSSTRSAICAGSAVLSYAIGT